MLMPTPMLKQSSSERIRKNPRCKAVKGCQDRALILSWKNPRGGRVPICARHYGRWKRTGSLGAAGHSHKGVTTRAELNERCKRNLQRIATVFGWGDFRYAGCAPGKFVLFSSGNPRNPTIPIPAFLALERRGLIEVDEEGAGQPTARISRGASG